MLGLVLIFFVGKYFYDLAGRYDKSEWGFAVLGVIVYYAGTFLVGIIIGILGEFGVVDQIEEIPTMVLSVLAIPAGMLTAYLTYRYLENRWDRPVYEPPSEVLDSDLINANSSDVPDNDRDQSAPKI